jgi:hypothetical protein
MAEGLSQDELKRLKRDASIRAKEEEFERKRKDAEAEKRETLLRLRKEFAEREQKKLEDRLAFLRKQSEVRAQRKANNERLNARREECIAHDRKIWLEKTNKEIHEVINAKQAEDDHVEELLEEARDRKRDREEAARATVREKLAINEELEMIRFEKNTEQEHKRYLKMIFNVDALKNEAANELESFIQHPYPVPLKQVLAGRLRPVPKVTELLAAMKDQREDLEDLEAQDVQMRATLRNQSLFSYIKDIQAKAETERVRPPEPSPGDMGRSKAKAGSRSPTGKKGSRKLKSSAGR